MRPMWFNQHREGEVMNEAFKEFYLERLEDESGISGTGLVARGVVLPSGAVVLEWQTFHSSISIYKNFSDIEAIHGHGGKTLVIMGSPPEPKLRKKRKSELAKKT